MSHTIVIAPDSFKGSLSAREVADAIAEGWRSVRPADELHVLPQADGGEGTLDVVHGAVPGALRHQIGLVTGPDGRPTMGEWLELPFGVGIVELAQTSGLPLMAQPDAVSATSRGLGEVIHAALDYGAQSLIVGLGGSASTDGGAGALAALGLRFLNASGLLVADGGRALADIVAVDRSALLAPPVGGVTLLTDVAAPLLGPSGSAAIFGPQKGASRSQVTELESALVHFASLLGGDPSRPGMGAAGGTAYGFVTGWGANIVSGADYLATLTGVDTALATADLVITGEGRFDEQSFGGKVVGQLLKRAASAGVRAVVIAGQVAVPTELWTASLTELAGSIAAASDNPLKWLHTASARIAAEFS